MLLLHAKHDPHSRYSHYLAEILRLEGFVDFAELELAGVDAETLARHDLVILPRVSLTQAQAELVQPYLAAGGRLIAMMPDANFSRRCGLNPTWRAIDGGWLQINTAQAAVAGLWAEPVQIVTPALGWQAPDVSDAQVLAHVRAVGDEAAAQTEPGAVAVTVGQGQAVFFAYDLPHAVARLRQGNPDHADLCYAGLDGIIRPSELFVGQMSVDQMLVPQADVHTALLARLIDALAPRPRLWYYPSAEQRSVLIMTSDDDWSTVAQFEALLAGLRQRQATCTFYVVPETKINAALMAQWAADGHTFSVHPALAADVRRGLAKDEPQMTQVAAMLRENVARHQRDYGHSPRTIRQHAVRWLGYIDAARILAKLGVVMELNYISVHPFSLGYMAGSGRPLPFVDTNGELIACLQQPTMWTEEVLIHPSFVFSFKWTVERALHEVEQMIARAIGVFYTPIAINSHPVSFATYSSPLIEGTWDRALAAGMTIRSADDWLAWTEARKSVRLEKDGEAWVIQSALPLAELTLLCPAAATELGDGASSQQLWGAQYRTVTLRHLIPGERRRL